MLHVKTVIKTPRMVKKKGFYAYKSTNKIFFSKYYKTWRFLSLYGNFENDTLTKNVLLNVHDMRKTLFPFNLTF